MWIKIQRLGFSTKGSIGMRLFAVVLALSVTLAAASTYAQAAAPAASPAGPGAPAPRPQAQTPSTAKQPDPPPAAALPPAPAPIPFREGAKFGWVNIQIVASQSQEGRNAATKINSLREQRQKELSEKQKALQAAQAKLETEGALRSDAAKASLAADIERQGKELNRLVEDAEQDVERLTQQLQQDFLAKLQPAIPRLAKEKNVDFIFQAESLMHGADDLNLTADLIRIVDAGAKPAPAAPAAAKPAPATPAPAPAN
jgi:outer membrane protein